MVGPHPPALQRCATEHPSTHPAQPAPLQSTGQEDALIVGLFSQGVNENCRSPPAAVPLLIAFAIMMAWQERLAHGQQTPTSNASLLLSQFAPNADRARRNYVQALGRARIAAAGTSAESTWRMDKYDRMY